MRKGSATGGVLIALTGAAMIGGSIVGLSGLRDYEADFLFERYTLTAIADSSGGGTEPSEPVPPGSTHDGSTNTHLASTDNHDAKSVTHNSYSDSHQTTSVTHLPVTANHKINSITEGTAPGFPGLHLANTDSLDPPLPYTWDRHKVNSMLHYLSTTWFQSPDDIHTSRTDTHHVGSDFHDYRTNTHKANSDDHDPTSNTHLVSTSNHNPESDTHLQTTTTHKPSTFYEVPGGPTEPWWIPWVSSVEELEALEASGYFDNPPPADTEDGDDGSEANGG